MWDWEWGRLTGGVGRSRVVDVVVVVVAVGGPLARPRLLPLRGERRRRLAPSSSSSAPGRVRPEWPAPTGACRRSGRRSPCSSVRASRPQVGSGLSGPAPEGACRRRGRCLACCCLFLCLQLLLLLSCCCSCHVVFVVSRRGRGPVFVIIFVVVIVIMLLLLLLSYVAVVWPCFCSRSCYYHYVVAVVAIILVCSRTEIEK